MKLGELCGLAVICASLRSWIGGVLFVIAFLLLLRRYAGDREDG